MLAVLAFFILGSLVVEPLSTIRPDYAESPTLFLFGDMLTFLVAFVTIPLIVALLHRRPYWSVAMPTLRVESWRLFAGFWFNVAYGLSVASGLPIAGVMAMTYAGFACVRKLPM